MIIDNFELIKQIRPNACGYTSAAMIINYFSNTEIDEDYLVEEEPFDEKGITFSKLKDVYSKHLKNAKAEVTYGSIDSTHEMIIETLGNNCPIQILHLTANIFDDGKPVLHYAVIIGYDDKNEEYIIADPYGPVKHMGKKEFYESVSFRNECLPEFIRKNTPSNIMIKFIRQ